MSELKRVGEIIPDVLRSVGVPSIDMLSRADRSLGRLDMIASVLREINRRTEHMAPSSIAFKSLASLSDWLAEQAERERP